MKQVSIILLLLSSVALHGCGSTPLCGAAGAAGGAYAGHELSRGDTGATIGGAAVGGLLGAGACD